MSELLFEIFSEEIPSRMQLNAREQLKSSFINLANKNNILFSEINSFVSTRRLCLSVKNISLNTNSNQEVKGPSVNADKRAIDGFANKYNIKIEDLEIISTDKGEFYLYKYKISNLNINNVIENILNEIIKNFYWPKSMRWGSRSETWVRPIRSIIAVYNNQILNISYAGIKANNVTKGHRFLSDESFTANNFQDYKEILRKKFVMLDFEEKSNHIAQEIIKVANELNLECDINNKLLEEVSGLVEWPLILVGEFDKSFLEVPEPILILTMQHHQRYFPLYSKNGNLSNKFIIVSNADYKASKGIIEGNQKVIQARLSDAKFFFEQDIKNKLENNVESLSKITFHKLLGTMKEKTERLIKISEFISIYIENCDIEKVKIASKLSKTDLVTHVVSEFPELQGIIGKIYAYKEGYDEIIYKTIDEHYLPLGPDSSLPSLPESCAVSLADKIDSIVGFFAIGEAPTSSKDPFALRRSALGIIRILINYNINLPLNSLIEFVFEQYKFKNLNNNIENIKNEITSFIFERYKHYKKSNKVSLDVYDAVMDVNISDNLSEIDNKIRALENITSNAEYVEILSSLNRVYNIVDKDFNKDKVSSKLLEKFEEIELFDTLEEIKLGLSETVKNKDYIQFFEIIKVLGKPINDFLDKVIVNVEDEKIRLNRISLLNSIKSISNKIANFSILNTKD